IAAADSDRCRAQNYTNMEMNESRSGRQSSSRFRQTADRAAADSDRCIAHNYKNTEMNESRSVRQQIQADSNQTADSDIRSRFRQTEQTNACRRNHPNNIQETGTIRY
ncbi:hypothetical protein Tco_1026389, partial [Tanacetum coccineum]